MSIQHRYHEGLFGDDEQTNSQMIAKYRRELWDALQDACSREEAHDITVHFRDAVWFSTHTEFGHPSSLYSANAWRIANRVGTCADNWIDSDDFTEWLMST